MDPTFVFSATAYRGSQTLEDLWIFGFHPGGWENPAWESNEVTTKQNLTNLRDQAYGAMAVTIAVPVPLADVFAVNSKFGKLRVFGTDRPDYLNNWVYQCDFDSAEVRDTKLLPKGTFKLPSSVQFKLLKKGSAAWLTPLAVLLFLKP
jgi:hypothetical protein